MSTWVGKLNGIIEEKIVVKGSVWREAWGNGSPKLYFLQDKLGNILTIRTTLILRKGQEWVLGGKIKRQHTFNGQRQTHISDWSLSV